MSKENKAKLLLTNYVEEMVSEAAQKYNKAEADEDIITTLFEDFDKLSYDFYHKVGLDKEFLSNLRYELLVLIRKMFCPATHAFSSLPDERKKESGYVYVIENEHGNVKIGKSISPLNRVRQIETIGGYKIIRKWVSQKTVFFKIGRASCRERV